MKITNGYISGYVSPWRLVGNSHKERKHANQVCIIVTDDNMEAEDLGYCYRSHYSVYTINDDEDE